MGRPGCQSTEQSKIQKEDEVMPYIESRWRRASQPIIKRVLEETRGQDEKAIRKALRDAYPFGPKEYHPYKIWLSEIAIQRGTKKTTPRVCTEHVYAATMGGTTKCLRCGLPMQDLEGKLLIEDACEATLS